VFINLQDNEISLDLGGRLAGGTSIPETIVVTDAPIKPSHVFFGDNLINGVLPRKNPNKYAAMSLITMSEAGRRNLCKHSIEYVWSL
jgi:hypothetical protein